VTAPPVPGSPEAAGALGPHYLRRFALAVAVLIGCCGVLSLTVDPYGVSPIGLNLRQVDQYRPKRIDIDRVLKPYEVWRYQPRTVFLGTSRVHQAIDPAVLDGTRLAPAYNASVPAVSLGMNVSYLAEYARLDRRLETVFVELFLYNFLGASQEHPAQSLLQFAADTGSLFLSYNAVFDAVYTLWYNLVKARPCYQIALGGYLSYPPGQEVKSRFDEFAIGMWDIDKKENGNPTLRDAAFATLDQLLDSARSHDVELNFVLTPYHPYFWHYIDATDHWDLIRDWLTRVTKKVPVLSFAQPNAWTYEPVGRHMTYWNDPFHFSLAMGDGIGKSLAGLADPSLPANFMVRLTPPEVASWVAAQREAVRDWARDNRDFVVALEAGRRRVWGTAR